MFLLTEKKFGKMEKNIFIPIYIQKGIKKNHVGFPKNINLMVGDTETKPYLYLGINDSIRKCRRKDIHKIFFQLVDRHSKTRTNNYLFFHNLKFDLQVIFLRFREYFRQSTFEIYFDEKYNEIPLEKYIKNKGTKIVIRMGSTCFADIYFKNKHVKILDSFAFFSTSLKKLTHVLNLKHKKTEWKETYDKKQLKKYLKNDLLCQRDLAEFIINLHREYDIRICVSIAQMSMTIFKHKFLKEKDVLTFPNWEIVKPAQLSYHGGKNGYYEDGVKKINNVYEYDVNSMYPYAMTQIPNFLNCKYDVVDHYDPKYTGIYCITGKIKKHKYPLFYTHDFKALKDGVVKEIIQHDKDFIRSFPTLETYLKENNIDPAYIDHSLSLEENLSLFHIKENEREYTTNVVYDENGNRGLAEKNIYEFENYIYVKNLWVTSYELNMGMKYNLVKLDKCWGFRVIEMEKRNPLKEFVNYFYKKKNTTPKDDPQYLFYKLILNSLYGKFIQNINHNSEGYYIEKDGKNVWVDGEYKAGGLYNPMIATLITGFSRAYIYDLERKYESIHTSTDSIKTTKKIPETGKELGKLSLKCFGDCLIFRGKCYVHFDNKIYCAKHGFHGSLEQLLQIYINKNTEYEYERMANIKESLIRKKMKLIPCEMNRFKSKLRIDFQPQF